MNLQVHHCLNERTYSLIIPLSDRWSTGTMKLTISRILKPCSETQATLYSEIRLAALATNPTAFGSKYSREAAFPLSTWIERLSGNGNITFYAHPHDSSPTNHDPSRETADAERWIGIITLLSPAFLASFPYPNYPPYPVDVSNAENKGADVWMLVGMWVRPEWRGKGVGKRLVKAAIEEVSNTSNDAVLAEASRNLKSDSMEALTDVWGKVREEPEIVDADLNPDERTQDGIILLLVDTDNDPAVKLYSSAGFRSCQDNGSVLSAAVDKMFGGNHGGGSTPGRPLSYDLLRTWCGWDLGC